MEELYCIFLSALAAFDNPKIKCSGAVFVSHPFLCEIRHKSLRVPNKSSQLIDVRKLNTNKDNLKGSLEGA